MDKYHLLFNKINIDQCWLIAVSVFIEPEQDPVIWS